MSKPTKSNTIPLTDIITDVDTVADTVSLQLSKSTQVPPPIHLVQALDALTAAKLCLRVALRAIVPFNLD